MDFQNLVQLLRTRIQERADQPWLRFHRDGSWHDWTYAEAGERIRRIAAGLAACGIQPGDRISICAESSPEWALADYASISAGAVPIGIYSTLTREEVAWLLRHSASKLVFVVGETQLRNVLSVKDELPALETIVLLSGASPGEDGVLTLDDLVERGDVDPHRGVMERMADRLQPGDPLVISYTSGTTGVPKGAVLTHSNILWTMSSLISALGDMSRFDLSLSFLPLAHALERFVGHYGPLYVGGTIAYARSLETVAEDFTQVRPRYATVVPRFLEKVYHRVHAQVEASPPLRRKIFHWAVEVGRRWSIATEKGAAIGPALALQRAIADRLVYSRIRNRMGGRVEIFCCGGAPLSENICRFFHAIGILVCEAWGLTETSAPATVNSPGEYRFGSVGKAMPGVELKVAEDGELLVRGGNVFREYYRDPEGTAAAFEADGFFRTGDIGCRDEDGFVYITDRKKEIIVTTAGKNIAPQRIEKLLKDRPLVANAIVHGDRRNYLVALISVDRDALGAKYPELVSKPASDPGLRTVIQSEVHGVNEHLARFEQVKDFRILDHDFSVEGGELTVTMKLKRRTIEEHHRMLLDSMYLAEPRPFESESA